MKTKINSDRHAIYVQDFVILRFKPENEERNFKNANFVLINDKETLS